MFAEFNKISVLKMLNNSEIFLVKEIGSGLDPEIQEEGDRESTSSTAHPVPSTNQTIPGDPEESDAVESGNSSLRKRSFGEFDATTAVSEEDDGFKTPTSLEHKIPVVLQCPPAPRRPTLNSVRKRKALTPNFHRRVLDLTDEVESLFTSDNIHRQIKKVRKSDSTDNHDDHE